ncbi:uncharacterized protein LOC143230414 isoform X2 [Tachypleus tridentatus]|uniref:uncharacterized protein LOC143230414 isoform X2 n=1 Tax=Tachypleus tridentatus TaxID=6853 RepID=UPI003FD486F2
MKLSGKGWFFGELTYFLSFFCLYITRTNPKEIEERRSCSGREIRFRCDDSIIAVHQAYFTTDADSVNVTCAREIDQRTKCIEDIRLSVNARCSGLTYCRYSYELDHMGKKCSGAGAVVIQFVCVYEIGVNKYCNTELRDPEGYIVSPGYPHFYLKLENCSWDIQAGDGQTISVEILDVSFKDPRRYHDRFICDEGVTVMEGGIPLISACGESAEALQYVHSHTDQLTIRFQSISFNNLRGFLLRYKIQGCPTLPSPTLGYLVYRNDSSALYMCCKDHLFNDTLQNFRFLYCVDGNRWNASMDNCVSSDEMVQAWNRSEMKSIILNISNSHTIRENELDFKEQLYIEEDNSDPIQRMIPSLFLLNRK